MDTCYSFLGEGMCARGRRDFACGLSPSLAVRLPTATPSWGTVMKLCVSPGWALPRAPRNLRALRSLISAKEVLEVPQSTGLAPSELSERDPRSTVIQDVVS